MNNILAFDIGLLDLACSAEECLCWIVILLNLLTIFYLVFCAYFRVTKPVKVLGYVWASVLTVGTVGAVALHTCIYTILSAVFSALILMAVLSVVLDKGVFAERAEKEKKEEKPLGCYVIHKTDDGKFVFLLYDNAKKVVCSSYYKYNSLVEVKSAIAVCRENGYFAAIENRTKKWVEYVNHPKFVLLEQDGKFVFKMTTSAKDAIVKSTPYGKYEKCEKAMSVAMRIVRSETVYFAENQIVPGDEYKCAIIAKMAEVELNDPSEPVKPAASATVDPAPAAVAPVKDKPATAVEEVAATEAPKDNAMDERVSGVVFDSVKKSLWELYAELSDEQRKYFDKIRARAEEKVNVKSSESKDAFTVFYGRDKIVKLRIRKNVVEAIFFVTDSAFKKLKIDSEAKVKETATVIRVINDEYLKFALETVDYRYDAVIEERKAKKAARKNKG